MMMAGSHAVIAVAAWVATGHPARDVTGLGLAVLGALLPDVDHPKSWAGRKLGPLSRLIAGVCGHRGVTHSLVAVVAAGATLRVGGDTTVAGPVALGYLSHLAADGLTPAGVPLLWPARRRFALPLCASGGLAEYAVVAGVVGLAAWAGGGLL